MADNEGLASLFEATGDDKKMDLDSESSDSSDGEGSGSSNSSSSESESDVGEATFSKKNEKDKKTSPPKKSPTKPSTALTEYDDLLMYKHDGLENSIRVFRVTTEKAKLTPPKSKDGTHVDFFCVKDVYENLDLANPRLGKDFSDAKRNFKCKSTGERRIGLPSWLIENVLNGIKKTSKPKNKKVMRELFKEDPIPYVAVESDRGTKRKMKGAETPKAKKPKTDHPKKGGGKTNSKTEQEFESLCAFLPHAYNLMPPDDKHDICNTLRKIIKGCL